jgi:hypothetical protein
MIQPKPDAEVSNSPTRDSRLRQNLFRWLRLHCLLGVLLLCIVATELLRIRETPQRVVVAGPLSGYQLRLMLVAVGGLCGGIWAIATTRRAGTATSQRRTLRVVVRLLVTFAWIFGGGLLLLAFVWSTANVYRTVDMPNTSEQLLVHTQVGAGSAPIHLYRGGPWEFKSINTGPLGTAVPHKIAQGRFSLRKTSSGPTFVYPTGNGLARIKVTTR